jgi:hypothetical protein
MPNSIDARVEFSFKGENYELSSTLDLDSTMALHIELSSMHHALAVEHGIDTYSYLFEVMQEEVILFANPQGDAAAYWSDDGNFDFELYQDDHNTASLFAHQQAIALREMGVEDLDQHPRLKNALWRAYQLGVEQ